MEKHANKILSFDDVLKLANQKIENIPDGKLNELKERLDHGLGELSTNEEMDMYISSYGEIHKKKLDIAFGFLSKKVLNECKISVIDYGCGQGIASMVLCDLFNKKGHLHSLTDFFLIEPIEPCLNRAIDNIHTLNPESDITYFNVDCGEMYRMTIKPKAPVVIHLLSNVLDIPEFPIHEIAHHLNSMRSYDNVVVCVSPFYQEKGRARHICEFGDMLRGYYCVHSFEKHADDWENSFSCQIRIYNSLNY